MKNNCFPVFFCFFIFSLFGFCQTEEKSLLFRPLTTEDGLSNNVIYDVLQTTDGYIWLATDNGLNRYDGYAVKVYYHKTDDSSTISSSVIRTLIEDLEGNLWIGTKSGVNLYNKKKQSFEKPIKLDDFNFQNQEVVNMKLDSNGNIWVNTLNDIGFFNPKTNESQVVYSSDQHPNMFVTENNVWVISSEGQLNRFNSGSNALISVVTDERLKSTLVSFGQLSRCVWVPHDFNRNGLDFAIRQLPILPNNARSVYLCEIDSNNVWLGTSEGLFEYNYLSKELNKIRYSESTLAQQIRSLHRDRYGGVWVGTLNGVYHYDTNRRVFNHYNVTQEFDAIIMGLHDVGEGIYANALGKGIYFKSINESAFEKIETAILKESGSRFIWDFETIPESDFPNWTATDAGIICHNNSFSEFREIRFPHIVNDKNISFSIQNVEGNHVWASSYRALHKIDKKTGLVLESFPMNTFIKHSGIQKISLFAKTIFIATEGEGLLAFDIETNKVKNISLVSDKDNNGVFKTPIWDLLATDRFLWIGTNQGLYQMSFKKMLIDPVLPDDHVVYSIAQDHEGVLWMGTDNGIKAFDPINHSIRYYRKADGMMNREFNRKSVAKSADGLFWFGGINGVTSFKPDHIKKTNPNQPLVHITQLKAISTDSSYTITNFEKSISIPWKFNTVELSYVGLNFTNPSQNSYKYIMSGYDPDWVSTGQPLAARYVKLPVGSYEFTVKASNNDGLWNEEGDRILIEIRPPIWRTKTAYFMYVLGLIGLIKVFQLLKKYRLRVKEVEKEKRLIAKKVDRIAITLNNKSKIYLDQLVYIKSDGNYLEFITTNKTIIDRNKLKEILDVLPPNYVRVHRSYVINKNFITTRNSTTVFLQPNVEIPISRTFKANLD